MERFATMFCTVCGNEIGQGQCFCGTCGSKCHPTTSDTMLQLGEEKEKERVPTFSEFLQNRNSDFDSVTKVKTAERRDRFLPKKKKKQGADLVKINVGIVHIVNGELKIKRSSLMPINVPKSSSSVIVRRAAIDKHKAHNVKLPDTLDWKLLYPDFQEVNNIPGSKHFFTVQKYHESLGSPIKGLICDHDEEECEDCEDDPTKPLDSSGEVVFNFQARRRRDQETDDIGHNSPNPVLPEDDPTKPLDSSGEVVFNFQARRRRDQEADDIGHNSPNSVLPVDILTSSSASVHVPSTESQEKESEANNIDDPYDLYCSVLYDKKQDLDDDELLLLDEAWIYSEMLGNSANQDPINGSVLLESVLRPLYEKMERAGEDQMQVVRVRRRHIWSDALRAFSKADFHTGVLLSVHFIGEEAADMGGPRREFLRLLMRSLVTESGVLTGSDTRKTFSSSPIHVTQMRYFHAGRMVATSLLQGGPGINCLSPAVYAYFSADVDKCRHLVNVEDIPDLVLQEKVQKIQSLSDDEFEDGVKEAADFLLDLGIAKSVGKCRRSPC
ncbi:hypothetical protein OS493_007048 [Desmophyllum pertusum]|uniref:HECT domain-containing protein n=1 Tax=Desmophyllum pertusum TaxID=174260 RepID=A0A9X0CYK5_9CNID|nr:hypothetical protein OS493_007048 [Desmophyllum pertusum]